MQIFSPILRLSFHFLNSVLRSTKVLNLDDVQFIYFFACVFAFMSKKPLPNSCSWRFMPIFYSENFLVLALAFRCLIHFELIFYMMWGMDPNLFFACGYPVVPFVEQDYSFVTELSWHTVCQSIDCKCDCFWTLKSIPLVYMSVLRPIPHNVEYCSFVIGLKSGSELSTLVFLKIVLASLIPLISICI